MREKTEVASGGVLTTPAPGGIAGTGIAVFSQMRARDDGAPPPPPMAIKAYKKQGVLSFDFLREPVFVNHYYFYVQDRQWGPGFVKVGSYVPYPVKICLNGHEWVKQQLRHEGIAFEALDNGFRWCEAPEQLQAICAGDLDPDLDLVYRLARAVGVTGSELITEPTYN